MRETIGDRPAIDLTHPVLKALWEEEADTGDRTLGRLMDDVGLDVPTVLGFADDGHWAELRSRETKEAIDRGVFGAPTYVVGEDIFWGQDRLEFVELCLRASNLHRSRWVLYR